MVDGDLAIETPVKKFLRQAVHGDVGPGTPDVAVDGDGEVGARNCGVGVGAHRVTVAAPVRIETACGTGHPRDQAD
jgi:hypothetical protein